MTPLDCFGEFWVPEMSDERLPGLLQFKPDGESSLRVMGQFGLSARTDSNYEPNSYFYNTFSVRIFGTFLRSDAITYKKECVTLEDAHLIGGDKNGMRFQFRRTLLGGHYDSNALFQKFDVFFDQNVTYYLAEKQGMSISPVFGRNEISISVPESEVLEVERGRLTLHFWNADGHGRHDAKLKLRSGICIEYKIPQTLDVLLRDIENLRSFFLAAMEYPVYIEAVHALPDDKSSLSYFASSDYKMGVEILYDANGGILDKMRQTDRDPYIYSFLPYEKVKTKGLANWWNFTASEKMSSKIPYLTRRHFDILDAGDMLVKNVSIIQELASLSGRKGIIRSLQTAIQKTGLLANGIISYEDCCWANEISKLRGKQAAHLEDSPQTAYLHRQADKVYYLALAYLLQKSETISEPDDIQGITIGGLPSHWSDEAFPSEYNETHKWKSDQRKCDFCGSFNPEHKTAN